jgi:4-amino-4-deoxy-L-arabinose transferase-like glycosyltransferase
VSLRAGVGRLRAHPWLTAFTVAFLALAALHLVALDSSPPGLYTDEASVGYNAWAVAHTGRDEHGHFLPFYFQAFGEYKNPVYIYALAPLTWVLPLTSYVVRLPAALFGLLACAMLALFAHRVTWSKATALLVLLTAGVTPWLAQESRLGFEVISMVALLAVMLWCLAQAVERDSWRWYAGAGAALGLSTFAYSTGRAFTAAVVVAMVLSFGARSRSLRSPSRAWMAAVVAPLASLITVAVYNVSHDGAIVARFDSIGILIDHPAPLTALQRFLSNYVDYWDFHFLFTHGDANLRHSTGYGGMLLVTTLPAILLGVAACLRRRGEAMPRFLLLAALLSPVPAALTAEGTPHSVRAATMLPFLLAFSAYGWCVLVNLLRERRAQALVLAAVVCVEAGGYFLDMYTAYPDRALTAFDTGQAEAVQRAVQLSHGHQVYVSDSLEGATIDSLFVLRPDPPSESSDSRQVLAALHVHVTDADTATASAQPGDMLVLGPDDPLPLDAQVVYVDRRTRAAGPFQAHGPPADDVVLVVVARVVARR